MRRQPLIILFLLVIGGGVSYFLSAPIVTYSAQVELDAAAAAYKAGEQAKAVGERREQFNQALQQYTLLEQQYHPTRGSGRLYFNIGNCYFQLGEYPMASLYYHKALQLMPRNPRIKAHLELVNDKLAIEEADTPSILEKVFFFRRILSLPEKLQLLACLTFFTWILATVFVWTGKAICKYGSFLTGSLTVVLLLSLAYTFYFEPVEALVIRSTALYRDAGVHYSHVMQDPLFSGTKLEIIDAQEEGRWLKVLTPNGSLGYVPSETVKKI